MNDNESSELDRLLESGASKPAAEEVSPAMQRSIVDRLTPSLAPVKQLPSQTVLTAQFLAVFAACAVAIATLAGAMGMRFLTGTQITCMALVYGFGAILFSMALASRMVPAARRLPLALVLALSGVALYGGFGLLFPVRPSTAFVSDGLACAIMETATALPAAVLFWLLARRGAPFMGAGFGAVVSGLAVFLGLAVVQTRCMFPNVAHLVVWHGGIAAVIVAAGAMIASASRNRLGRPAL